MTATKRLQAVPRLQEKYEQELQESRGKAEIQLKDIERRLSQERETWMLALKNQLKERETIERDVEQDLSRKLRDSERRHEEEKIRWAGVIRLALPGGGR